jgi:ADP-heptose:LPS heptosyltransferase
VLTEYFELGWEYIVSHLHIKHLYSTGGLDDDDVIVTLKDRMFLYQGFWPNVISFEKFLEKNITENVIDICQKIELKREYYLPKIEGDKYIHFDNEKDVINNIKYIDISHLDTTKPYCCLHLRYRKWAEFRNLSKEFWRDLIKKIELSGLNIYIFGKEAKEFANGINVFHVELDEYASLLNNDNCKYLIGSMSGGTLVAQTFSNINCINYVIITDEQTYNEYKTDYEYKVFYHIKEMNFSKAPIKYISFTDDIKDEKLMTIEQLLNEI